MTRFWSNQDFSNIDLLDIGGTVIFQLTETKSEGV